MTTHGEASNRAGKVTPEYRAWAKSLSRCYNQNNAAFADYGGRGITVCDKWRRSYGAFLADVGRRPSPQHQLDRYPDNNGNYEPGNVRWATTREQARNRRSNHILAINGIARSIIEWSEISGVHYQTIFSRLKRGWPACKAVIAKNSPRSIGETMCKNEEPITDEEYFDLQTSIILTAHMVGDMPLQKFLDRIARAEAVGPVVDPNLYRAAGERLHKIKTVAAAMRVFQQVIQKELDYDRLKAAKLGHV